LGPPQKKGSQFPTAPPSGRRIIRKGKSHKNRKITRTPGQSQFQVEEMRMVSLLGLQLIGNLFQEQRVFDGAMS